ncbi:sarcosine oxidase subunit gamma [Falsihalocynthiibacter sp. SS001]|uniref:sarcosine oxidase subunit gamma n=1 Tax=Falsihalocynthiibacter sp. SS001 TaxID=3349698 RepID=UPI0036D2E630
MSSKHAPQSPLEEQVAEGRVEVREMGLQGMITLRADLANKKVRSAVEALVGVEMPQPRRIAIKRGKGIAWMSPDEVLIILPYSQAAKAAAKLSQDLEKEHALVANVSDARAVFTLSGAEARDVLGKLAPVDLSTASFAKDEVRRTRIAQTSAAFWMSGTAKAPYNKITIIVFRSVARYAFDLLAHAAKSGAVEYYSGR